jgi:hypothetical protein
VDDDVGNGEPRSWPEIEVDSTVDFHFAVKRLFESSVNAPAEAVGAKKRDAGGGKDEQQHQGGEEAALHKAEAWLTNRS